jgi:NitT/TauT family transport system ATP-binding protein
MVFQSYSSFPWLTVEGNIAFGMRYRNDLAATQRAERVSHYLKLIGLEDFAKSFPNRISGGMRQRVAIARSLAAGSDVLLMDEPFGALDALTRERLQVELRQIQTEEKKTIIFVTHDVEEAVFLADRIILFSARPARVLKDIDVAAVLGGTRTLAIRESQEFFKLRNDVLHRIRNEAGVVR